MEKEGSFNLDYENEDSGMQFERNENSPEQNGRNTPINVISEFFKDKELNPEYLKCLKMFPEHLDMISIGAHFGNDSYHLQNNISYLEGYQQNAKENQQPEEPKDEDARAKFKPLDFMSSDDLYLMLFFMIYGSFIPLSYFKEKKAYFSKADVADFFETFQLFFDDQSFEKYSQYKKSKSGSEKGDEKFESYQTFKQNLNNSLDCAETVLPKKYIGKKEQSIKKLLNDIYGKIQKQYLGKFNEGKKHLNKEIKDKCFKYYFANPPEPNDVWKNYKDNKIGYDKKFFKHIHNKDSGCKEFKDEVKKQIRVIYDRAIIENIIFEDFLIFASPIFKWYKKMMNGTTKSNDPDRKVIEEAEKMIGLGGSYFFNYFFYHVIIEPSPGLKKPWLFEMMTESFDVLKDKMQFNDLSELKMDNEFENFEKLKGTEEGEELKQKKYKELDRIFERFKARHKTWMDEK